MKPLFQVFPRCYFSSSFVHSFVRSFIREVIQSFIHSVSDSSFVHSVIRLFIRSFVHEFRSACIFSARVYVSEAFWCCLWCAWLTWQDKSLFLHESLTDGRRIEHAFSPNSGKEEGKVGWWWLVDHENFSLLIGQALPPRHWFVWTKFAKVPGGLSQQSALECITWKYPERSW